MVCSLFKTKRRDSVKSRARYVNRLHAYEGSNVHQVVDVIVRAGQWDEEMQQLRLVAEQLNNLVSDLAHGLARGWITHPLYTEPGLPIDCMIRTDDLSPQDCAWALEFLDSQELQRWLDQINAFTRGTVKWSPAFVLAMAIRRAPICRQQILAGQRARLARKMAKVRKKEEIF